LQGTESCTASTGASGPGDELLAENARLELQLDGLHRALQSRASIEQAKGVLMAFCRCSEADAFTLLARLSQVRNVRLRWLADTLLRLAATGFEVTSGNDLEAWLRDQVLHLSRTGRPLEKVNRPPRGRPT